MMINHEIPYFLKGSNIFVPLGKDKSFLSYSLPIVAIYWQLLVEWLASSDTLQLMKVFLTDYNEQPNIKESLLQVF